MVKIPDKWLPKYPNDFELLSMTDEAALQQQLPNLKAMLINLGCKITDDVTNMSVIFSDGTGLKDVLSTGERLDLNIWEVAWQKAKEFDSPMFINDALSLGELYEGEPISHQQKIKIMKLGYRVDWCPAYWKKPKILESVEEEQVNLF